MENLGKAPCKSVVDNKCIVRVPQKGKDKDLLIIVSENNRRILNAYPADPV